MSNDRQAASAVRLRIGRLVIDEGVLCDNGVPDDFDVRLRAALSSHLDGTPSAPGLPRHEWIESVAAEIVSGVRKTMPGGSP